MVAEGEPKKPERESRRRPHRLTPKPCNRSCKRCGAFGTKNVGLEFYAKGQSYNPVYDASGFGFVMADENSRLAYHRRQAMERHLTALPKEEPDPSSLSISTNPIQRYTVEKNLILHTCRVCGFAWTARPMGVS